MFEAFFCAARDEGPGRAAGGLLGSLGETKGLIGLRYFTAEDRSVEKAERQLFSNHFYFLVSRDYFAI